MRVTDYIVTNNVLYNLRDSQARLQKYQDQISSGKVISRPSDDPRAAVTALRLRTALSEAERYISNINEAKGWMQTTESALGDLTTILGEAVELATRGANSTLPQESRDALAKKVGRLLEEAVQIGNTSHAGRFVFGGFNTTSEPFPDPDGTTCNSSPGEIKREIAPGITMGINITGQTAFVDGPGVLSSLRTLKSALEDPSADTGFLSAQVGKINECVDYVISLRADMGARLNRLELALDRLTNSKIDITSLLSAEEDTDVAEAAIKLATEETAYRAWLAVAARIIQPTLIDFLR